MANASAFTTPPTNGAVFTAAQATALDNGQVAALTRSGTTPLTGATVIQTASFNLDVDSSGGGNLRLTQSPAFTSAISATRTQRQLAVSITGFAQAGVTYLQNSTGGSLVIPISNVIDGATLTTVAANVLCGGAGGGGTVFTNLPGTMPSIQLVKYDRFSGATSSLGTQTDTSGTVGAFNAQHAIGITGLTEVMGQHTYSLTFNGAGGVNYVNNSFFLASVVCTFTVPTLTPGG